MTDDYRFYVEVAILCATILAIIYGPIKAVEITRKSDQEREKHSRQYSILSDLMRTRKARIDASHVAALNLIELDFYGSEDIISAYKEYARHLNSHFPQEDDALQRHLKDGDRLFGELLRRIAKELGYSFDKGDLDDLSYLPQGLGRHHDNSMMNAQLLREVLEGRRALPISNYISNDAVFPPPPERSTNEKQT